MSDPTPPPNSDLNAKFNPDSAAPPAAPHGVEWSGPAPDWPFLAAFGVLGGAYVLMILAPLAADFAHVSSARFWSALASREIQFAIKLSLASSVLTAIFSVWVAVPLGYLMSRMDFRGKALVEGVLDIPFVLPPLALGLSLLIFFQTSVGKAIEGAFAGAAWRLFGVRTGFTYRAPGVVLAQFMVACAFAARTMRAAFDQAGTRQEGVALTLGCGRARAFWWVTLPQAWGGVRAAATVAWARALGEFGPVLVFAGATRMRTEVLPTSIFLELSVGDIEAAVAVSLLMVGAAVAALTLIRLAGPNGRGNARVSGRAARRGGGEFAP